jgi:cyclopropane fatty-acyl-phospholipid synthase-like methyltransferase
MPASDYTESKSAMIESRNESLKLYHIQDMHMNPNAYNLSDVQKQFPRSAVYDLKWVMENLMGPNALWLTEALTQVITLKPGMRVLDLGCGKAVSSIFLAKEFDVQVWATDLWIDASENSQRIHAAGLEDQVFPIHAEAHALPFADGFFDAVVSMDAYHYFGTDDLYLGRYLTRLMKPGSQAGIVVPGLKQESSGSVVPDHLKPYWEWDFCSFHSPGWWQQHWEKTGKVAVERADWVPDGWQHWLLWHNLCQSAQVHYDAKEAEMVSVDAGQNLGFTRLVAHKR